MKEWTLYKDLKPELLVTREELTRRVAELGEAMDLLLSGATGEEEAG